MITGNILICKARKIQQDLYGISVVDWFLTGFVVSQPTFTYPHPLPRSRQVASFTAGPSDEDLPPEAMCQRRASCCDIISRECKLVGGGCTIKVWGKAGEVPISRQSFYPTIRDSNRTSTRVTLKSDQINRACATAAPSLLIRN